MYRAILPNLSLQDQYVIINQHQITFYKGQTMFQMAQSLKNNNEIVGR